MNDAPLDDIRLVPFTSAHVRWLAEMWRDRDSLRFTRVPDPMPPDFPQTWLQGYEDGRRDGTREAFAILDGRGDFLGTAVVPSIDAKARTAELGYVVNPAARGRGVATRALRLLTDWAFVELDAIRLELLISVENEGSKAVARHNGYTYEGTLRSIYVKRDIWKDCEVWSRLSTDPSI